jgi:LPXTG-site transpeptidase (sortase) family protein
MSVVRKGLLAIGAITFVAGVALLGAGIYSSLQGGDERPQSTAEVRDLRTPAPTRRPATATASATPKPTSVPLGQPPYTIVIDKIGVNAPVETFGLDEQAIPVVPTGDNAADVVAWYNFSAEPGAGSNAVFAGHVTWFGAAVFYNLPSLAIGDEVRIQGANGRELVYHVSDVFHVDPEDPNSLNVMKATDEEMITIITCDGSYTDTNDPVFGGEYDLRLVVRATLTTDSGAPPAVSAGG